MKFLAAALMIVFTQACTTPGGNQGADGSQIAPQTPQPSVDSAPAGPGGLTVEEEGRVKRVVKGCPDEPPRYGDAPSVEIGVEVDVTGDPDKRKISPYTRYDCRSRQPAQVD